jgi:hypothetical protein
LGYYYREDFMTTSNRFPTSYTILAGLAGAVAWVTPYLILPFIPGFPPYESPPYKIHLTELTISFSVAGMVATCLFLMGLGVLPFSKSYPRPALSPTTIFAALVGMAVGGAFAALFGFGIGFSPMGYSMMASLDVLGKVLDKGPEPFLSIGLVIGTALAAIITSSFSGFTKQLAPAKYSPSRATLDMALKASGMALIGRVLVCSIEFSSFASYTAFGQSTIFFFLVLMAGGALFGALTWVFCSSLKAV